MANSLESYLRTRGARKSHGTEVMLKCPFCGKWGDLYVNTEAHTNWKGEDIPAGAWICFAGRCGQSSRQFAYLLAELEGITLPEARSMFGVWKMGAWRKRVPPAPIVVDVCDDDAEQPDGKMDGGAPIWIQSMVPEFIPIFDGSMWHWPDYLGEHKKACDVSCSGHRGISRGIARYFGLGFARDGEFGGRIIIPVECPLGRSFIGRATRDDETLRYKSGPHPPDGVLMFGWETLQGAEHAVIVEGSFDAMRVFEAGYPVGGLLGMRLRDGHVNLLARTGIKRFTVLLDPGASDSAVDIADQLPGQALVGIVCAKDPDLAGVDGIRLAVDSAKTSTEVRRDLTSQRIRRFATGYRTR